MQEAIEIPRIDIEIEVDIVSAHRTPEKLFSVKCTHMGFHYCRCRGAAHLPGIASMSPTSRDWSSCKIVLIAGTVFINTTNAWRSSRSDCSIEWAKNAGILAAQIIGSHDKKRIR
jgi:5-(carboxyamino)imidazole ribonucleotide mutase